MIETDFSFPKINSKKKFGKISKYLLLFAKILKNNTDGFTAEASI